MESAFRTIQIAENPPAADDDPNAPHGPWSHAEMLLAAVFDSIQQLINVQISRAGVETDPPAPMRRPGVDSRAPKVSPQQAAYLQRLREHNERQREGDANG